jgi:hypothetical protein
MFLTSIQASKTFLETHVDSFANMTRDTLILQGLLSLKASLQSGELDASNCTVAIVGKDQVSSSGHCSAILLSMFNAVFGSLSRYLTALLFNHSSTPWMRRKWRFFSNLHHPPYCFADICYRGVPQDMRWSSNKRQCGYISAFFFGRGGGVAWGCLATSVGAQEAIAADTCF